MIAKPDKIFKYERFNAQSLKNLKAQSIYFASPLLFNDPYDCAITTGFKKLDDNEVIQIRDKYLKTPGISTQAINEFVQSDIQKLREMFHRIADGIVKNELNNFLTKKGVSCFSESNNDLLMWAHYGDCYKGFCLGFSTKFEPFDTMSKVKYSNKMPQIDLAPMLLKDDFGQFIDLFYTKSISWQYEKEWRGLHHDAGTLYTYPAAALTDIYCGPEMDRESLEIICLIINGQNPNVRFWEGKRSKIEFKVDFNEFTYTSFLKAKELGLVK